MPKKFLLFLGLAFFLTGCSFQVPFRERFGSAALQVASTPKAKVFLNDQLLGETPINNKKLKSGTYTLKLATDNQEWVGTVRLQNSTVTVVNREFDAAGNAEAGDVISLENGDGLAVIGSPANAQVFLDQKNIGTTPLYISDISDGVHEFAVEKDGFTKRTLKLKATKGYKLVINSDLAIDPNYVAQTTTDDAATTPIPASDVAASQSPAASPSTRATASSKPTAKPTGSTQTATRVRVDETPNGFLRVRSGPSTANVELFRIQPGDVLSFSTEQNGWAKVTTTDGKEGWASLQYLTKIP